MPRVIIAAKRSRTWVEWKDVSFFFFWGGGGWEGGGRREPGGAGGGGGGMTRLTGSVFSEKRPTVRESIMRRT